MTKIDQKSIGMLFDELCTVLIKCFMAQEEVMKGGDDATVAAAATKTQQLNARRNQLIRAIDERLGEADVSPTEKTYDTTQVSMIKNETWIDALKETGYKVGLNSNGWYIDFPNDVRCGFSFKYEIKAWEYAWEHHGENK